MIMTSKKVCVVGTSYIGAVVKAYSLRNTGRDGFEVDFYGHSNGGFRNVDIAHGRVINARFRTRQEPADISIYDVFFIYADLPSPHQLERLEELYRKGRYSAQVARAATIDSITGTSAFRLYQTIRKLTSKPVFVFSANVMSETQTKLTKRAYGKHIACLREILGGGAYVPFPDGLFDKGMLPLQKYYKGSVLLTGEDPDPERHAGHDFHHMNEKGGALILDQILDLTERTLSGEARI